AGYEIEEASHLSVAASVAAGGADAGFGLRAAALRFGLGFVPIGTETYWLAGLEGLDKDRRVRALMAAVRRFAADTPGYGPAVEHRPRKPATARSDRSHER
ncbi:MAG TPA: substrate-binding domain-containing protein, partial [Burkholderiaceae bacterium]|nr:substrate-binding domain-containing protein [Burkholderiaceae bacterium]